MSKEEKLIKHLAKEGLKVFDTDGNLKGTIKKDEKEIREILNNVKGIYSREQIQVLEEKVEKLKE